MTVHREEPGDGLPEALKQQREYSDMWRALVLFGIFLVTMGLAFVPSAQLPVLLSLARITPEEKAKSDAGSAQTPAPPPSGKGLDDEAAPASGMLGKGFGLLDSEETPQTVRAVGVGEARGYPGPGADSPEKDFSGESRGLSPRWDSASGGPTGMPAAVVRSDSPRGMGLTGSGDQEFPAVGFSSPGIGTLNEDPVWPIPGGSGTPNGTDSAVSGEGLTFHEALGPEGQSAISLQVLAKRFQELGAVRYRLEEWGDGAQLFRFVCEMPVPGVSKMTRIWEAVAPSGEEAMLKVLNQILAEQAGGGGL